MTENHQASVSENLKDIAYVRSLVGEGTRAQLNGGVVLIAGGVLYGLQCLVHWLHFAGLYAFSDMAHLINGILPTVLFLIVVAVVMWRDRRVKHSGVATRALNAAFGGAGLANLIMNLVFGYVAFKYQMWLIWMLYPAVLCALLGAALYVAYMIRRKGWLALVAGGWFVTALLLAWRIETAEYMLILSAALFGLMAVPGYIMMRQARQAVQA
ncbi:hypothetical protein [Asticcacaulis tiandongensis]|uniref:hypothetical protein n=1 Tax=Asticcacaulis tiandongensis TaxID=2565365 RepID=UPI001128FD64|nr:hypothetical protein [Asticcacaulis tiandongensis]